MRLSQTDISQQNIRYYDQIAVNYDAILKADEQNIWVRKQVADKLRSLMSTGLILDFGGGTGEDLKWLLANNYQVIFCEPSSGMRQIAINKNGDEHAGNRVVFLGDDKVDFTCWNTSLPFEEKASAVIGNFAVLNCILNIDLFFENIAMVTATKAEVILLVLDYNLKKRLSVNFLGAVRSLISKKPMNINIWFQNEQQQVYIHSLNAIKKAAAGNFNFISCKRLKSEGFLLIHLTKK